MLSKDDSSVITGDLFPQGLEIVFRVGLAILQMNQTELIQLDMEGMLQVYITLTSTLLVIQEYQISGAKRAAPSREEPLPHPVN